MSFFRHREIYRPIYEYCFNPGGSAASRWSAPGPGRKTRRKERALIHRLDEFPAGYSLAGCSPAEPTSAYQPQPAYFHLPFRRHQKTSNGIFAISRCLRLGVHSKAHSKHRAAKRMKTRLHAKPLSRNNKKIWISEETTCVIIPAQGPPAP